MNKSGLESQTWWELGAIILIALGTIVWFGFYSPAQAAIKQGTDIQACTLSAKAASDEATSMLIELDCPTQDVVVKPDGVWRSSFRTQTPQRTMSYADAEARLIQRGIAKPEKSDVLTEMALYTAANEMATCWQMFGEGQDNPFAHGALVSDTHCVVCSTISFNDAFRQQVGKTSLAGFKVYLEQTAKDATGATFASYLRPKVAQLERVYPFIFEIQVKESSQGVQAIDTLDLTNPLDIIFQAESPSRLERFYEELGMTGNARAVFAVQQRNEGVLQCDVLF
jgi:hypothetical protein